MTARLLAHGGLAVALLLAAAPSRAQDDDRQNAIRLTRRAQTAYREGRFEEAVELLEAAHTLFPEPTVLYNLARSREALGQDEEAIDAYRRYLAQRPDADNAPAARARLDVLERRLEERRRLEEAASRTTEEEPAATPPPSPSSPGPTVTPWPWIVAGLGAASLGTGIGLGALAQSRADEASAAPNHELAYPLAREAEDLELAANVLLVAGGTVLLVGALWGVLEIALQ